MARTGATLVLCLSLALSSALSAATGDIPRESRSVMVGGKAELWQLVWEGKPSSVCGPEDVETAMTCPCTGFAYGEMGRLSLVRKSGGKEIERMALGPLFAELPADNSAGLAAMQWRPFNSRDFDIGTGDDKAAQARLHSAIKARKGPQVMKMMDLDHDGQASEFLIQVAAGPCGHTDYVAVGVSKAKPRLHALSTAIGADKGEVLNLPGSAWQVLAGAKGSGKVTSWPCGDHGSERREELVLSARGGRISVKSRSYSCPEDGSAEKLIEEQQL